MAGQRVYRSREDRLIGGICGGLGEYFDVDPTILRISWVAITVFSGVLPGVLVYCIALFIVPQTPPENRSLQKTVIEVKGYSK